MEGVVINVMSKAKKPAQSRNLSAHNYQVGEPTGNRDDSLKMYNFDVLGIQGMETVQNYNKFFKKHMHVGYKAHKEELGKDDFVLPRDGADITKIESIIVAPDIKILLKDIKNFDFSELQCFFDDYIFKFIKRDIQFKNIKILSAKVHCNEVFFPRFKEVEENGVKKLVKLSMAESFELAYIKPHMHMDYIPLVEVEKDGIKYLKCSSKELWKAQEGRYFDSYREYNDRLYEAIGKEYGIDRGQKWEEWDARIQKKNNGEAVKKTIKLSEWQIKKEEEMNEQYIRQLEEERYKYSAESQDYKKLTAEIEKQKHEAYNDFLESENKYKNQLERIQQSIKLALKEAEKAEEKRKKEIKETDELCNTTQQLKQQEEQIQKEIQDKIDVLVKEKEKYDKAFENAEEKYASLDYKVKILTQIELALKNKEMSDIEALQELRKGKLDDVIRSFKKEDAPELHRIKNLFLGDDPR